MHFSLDIETLSLKPNAAILSVAIVPFDRIVVREGYLYEVVDLAEYNRYSGFHIIQRRCAGGLIRNLILLGLPCLCSAPALCTLC